MMENRWINNIVKIVSVSIFASVQESFIVLFLGYLFNVIYLIGDTRQLIPLLSGLIIGTFTFTIIATIQKKFTSKAIGFEVAVIVFSVIMAWYVMSELLVFNSDFQYSNLILTVEGILIASPIIFIQHYAQSIFHIIRPTIKAIEASLSSAMMVLIVIIFAFLYERGGQELLPMRIELMGLFSIILTFLGMRIMKKN